MSETDAARRNIVHALRQHAAEDDASRITIRETKDGLGISNPPVKMVWAIAFMAFWLSGWAVGEYFALREIFSGRTPLAANLFLLVWVTGWTFGGGAVIWFLLLQLLGVEKLFITADALVIEKGLAGLTRRRIYPLSYVSAVRLAAPQKQRSAVGNKGSIAFDTPDGERRFGIDMDDTEAKASLAAIRHHLPAAIA